MSRGTIRHCIALFLVVVLPATLYSFPALVADGTPECQHAAAWVAAHEQALPSELDRLVAFPTVYQRAILTSLSSSQQISIWRTRLTRAISDPVLNASQRAVIEHISEQLEEVFRHKDSEQTMAIEGLIESAFPPGTAAAAKAHEIFYSLGGAPQGRLTLETAR